MADDERKAFLDLRKAVEARPTWYYLVGHEVMPISNGWGPEKLKYLDWFERHHPVHVGDTTIGKVRISTVFLALDHSFFGGPPVLFETMVFGGTYDREQERYCTWDEAAAGHARWVQKVKDGIGRAEG